MSEREKELECVISDLTRQCREAEAEAERDELRKWKEEAAKQEADAYGNMSVTINANDRVLFLACEKIAADRYNEQCYELTPLYTKPIPSPDVAALQKRVAELEDALRKVDDAAIECEGEDGELVFSVDADIIHAVRELLDPILANTQGDKK